MRSDMSKVIVERPRLRLPPKNGSAYPRGRLKNRCAPNLADAPRIQSMGGTYARKWLNENLQPLVRFPRKWQTARYAAGKRQLSTPEIIGRSLRGSR